MTGRVDLSKKKKKIEKKRTLVKRFNLFRVLSIYLLINSSHDITHQLVLILIPILFY